jgi:hypothetical protein
MARSVARLAAKALCCAVVIGLGLTGCYDVPKPACGFQCGANLECPDDYTCTRGRCILDGSPLDISCPGIDAGFPTDAPETIDANEPPRLVSRSPGINEDDVAITTTISIAFNEPVNGIDASSFLVQEGNVQLIDGTLTFPDARSAVFTPSAPLKEGVLYTVFLTTTIVDNQGAPFPSDSWSFTTVPDLTPPAVTARVPAPDSSGIKIDAPITVQFSEGVNINSSTFRVMDENGTIIPAEVSFDPSTHTASYEYLNFGVLQPNTEYTVRLSGGITDPGGNPLPNTPVTWSFTTGDDDIPPTIDTQTPPRPGPGDTGVLTTAIVEFRFSEEVLGVNGTNLTLSAGGSPVPATVNYFAGSWFAQIIPTTSLASNTTYKVTISSGVTDVAGNPLANAPVEWTFTTAADNIAPTISARLPGFGASNVSLSSVVTVGFTEHVVGVSSSTLTLTPGGGTVSYNAAAKTATLVPTTQLAPATTYRVELDPAGIKDPSGNQLAGTTSWVFTTVFDGVAPTAMLTTPSNGATGVASTTPIVVTFDETVQNVTGASFRVTAGGTGVGGNFSSAMNNQEWTFIPFSPLPASTTVTVSLTNDIADAFNNRLVPVSFSFTTAP